MSCCTPFRSVRTRSTYPELLTVPPCTLYQQRGLPARTSRDAWSGRDADAEAAARQARLGERGLMRTRLVVTAVVVVLASLASDPTEAGPPTDQVKNRVDRVIKILDDPLMKPDSRTAARGPASRAIPNELFDFSETSQRSLARHWQSRAPAEREEFTRLFGDLLAYSYASKIEVYSGEKILYVGEQLDGDLATVRTRIVTKQGTEIPVDSRLARQGDQWSAYDVQLEGVSLVSNYRTQFNAVIQRTSYADLVKTLRVRRDEAAGKPSAVAPAVTPAVAPPPAQTPRPRESP